VTLVADPRRPAPPIRTGAGRVARRLWDAPVGCHLAALALVLLALVPLLGTGASFSADEGAVIVQARSLADGDGWIVPHPFPEADPLGVNYPLENSELGTNGTSPYAKHPLYPLLLAGASRVGGVAAMVALSVAGTLAAAGLAAALARRIDPSLARPTLWVAGLASPLLFDGFVVIAHTLGAATAVAAVLLAARALERRSVLAALAIGPCVAAAVLLRSEAVFLAAGLAAAALAVGLLHRRLRGPALSVAAVTIVFTLATRLGEGAWTSHILGGPVGRPSTSTSSLSSGGLDGRVRGFVLTWLTPGYGAFDTVHLALVVMLAAVVIAAFAARRHPDDSRMVAGAAVIAAVAAAVALAAAPTNIVPGLLVAFPLAAAGLLLVDRDTLRLPPAQLAFGTFVLFSLGVIATQYARGGSGEWGGRYFALGLPVVVPVLLLAVRNGARRLPHTARTVAGGSLAVCLAATSVMAVSGLAASHRRNETINAAVSRAARVVAPRQTVIVATDGATARLGWPLFPTDRWLLSSSDLEGLLRRVTAAGVEQFVVVTKDPSTRDRLGPSVRIVDEESGGPADRPWQVLVVADR
jgi:hypothetical protein